ncbi:MAG: hypothetical protein UY92_C0009G0078 [Candidatus Magasanikbacteria bacterium GW2011_GWA2_56_11]|uniref:GatB/YqeY domain-containing protein n=1 Tax=Candidatus Magasanikbacteria bacterium GW2011_GWA2_56_11 TaxID=1619044 RepID=A0A0G2B9X3_9BACT|nr:MAG: hypothetical protein UY92_C0009G0078 [Candidatus Magasanikbacteria bacterium GW2011_GWA2_56_11]
MSIPETLASDREAARKAHDEKKLSILQLALSALKNEQIALGRDLSTEEAQAVLRRQVKQLQDALADFRSGGRDDLAAAAEGEIAILETYLPEPLSDEELEAIARRVIAAAGASSPGDVGRVMGSVIKEVKGQADGGRVRAIVSRLLAGGQA